MHTTPSLRLDSSTHAVDWAVATGGRLTGEECRSLLWPITKGFITYAAGMPRLLGSGHQPLLREPTVPDSKLARLAEEAAHDQAPELIGHGYRTWLLGGCLAERDGNRIDPELLFVVALLHDAGLASAVIGEDFTIRSAAAITRVCDGVIDACRATQAADAAIAHATPGIDRAADPLAFYVQAGAMADLIGMRSWELERSQLRSIYDRHPRHDVHRRVAAAVRREAKAVPRGRFALLRRTGLPTLMACSPTRHF